MMRFFKTNYFLLAALLVFLAASPAFCAAPAAPATNTSTVPAMRSRIYSALTGYEIRLYLERNDVIFIPCGPTELNDGNPVDVEYVVPLAYAIKLAEKSDGLVLPYVAYIDPGSTVSEPATILSSAGEGAAYIKTLVRSLIRQGFRRIVFLSGHGPAFHTIVPAADDIFYETHVPSVWIEPSSLLAGGAGGARGAAVPPKSQNPGDAKTTMSPMAKRTYGAYKIVGRLNDMPVGLRQPPHEYEHNVGLEKLGKILGVWNGKVPAFYADGSEHGGFITPVTAEQRDQWGKEGEELIESQVNAFDINGMLDALREHTEFTKHMEERIKTLPGNKTSVNVKP
jgi:creatinine amidohydrolase